MVVVGFGKLIGICTIRKPSMATTQGIKENSSGCNLDMSAWLDRRVRRFIAEIRGRINAMK